MATHVGTAARGCPAERSSAALLIVPNPQMTIMTIITM